MRIYFIGHVYRYGKSCSKAIWLYVASSHSSYFTFIFVLFLFLSSWSFTRYIWVKHWESCPQPLDVAHTGRGRDGWTCGKLAIWISARSANRNEGERERGIERERERESSCRFVLCKSALGQDRSRFVCTLASCCMRLSLHSTGIATSTVHFGTPETLIQLLTFRSDGNSAPRRTANNDDENSPCPLDRRAVDSLGQNWKKKRILLTEKYGQ